MLTIDVLKQVLEDTRPLLGQGHVASYIPALQKVSGKKLGIAVCDIHGQVMGAGDYQEPFSIQSISKILSLTVALQSCSDPEADIWSRVGKNQSGDGFNSLTLIEQEQGIPRNPFINAGAIVVCDVLNSCLKDPKQDMLQIARQLSQNPHVQYDDVVAKSEMEHSDRNASIAHLMKSFGNFHNGVQDVLKNYFTYCSLTMSCEDVAKTFLYLANEGHTLDGTQIIDSTLTRRMNSLLATSGLYDGAGEFAYRVGMPGKSGVGGGIIAIIPKEMAICVWSPELDADGNSLAGMMALEHLSNKIDRSIY